MAHAKLSPSSAVRWMACPGSVVLSEGIPERRSPAAAYGTVGHEIAESCILDDTAPARFLGQKWYVGADGLVTPGTEGAIEVTVDQELVDIVAAYVDYVRGLIAECGDNLWMVEQKVPLEHLTGEPGATGTADFIGLAGRTLIVTDLKTGHHEVEAEGNPQLRIYALGAMHKYGVVWDFDEVRVVIVQPKVGAPKSHAYTVAELEAFGLEVQDRAAEVARALRNRGGEDFDGDFLNPTPDACRHCPARHSCPALRAVVDEVTAQDFDDLDDDKLGDAMAKVELVEAWCKEVRAEVERRLLAGKPVRGFKLVQGRKGPRKWTSPDVVETLLSKAIGEEAYEKKLISPTTAEKVLKKERPLTWQTIAEYVAQSDGSPSVAPESDKREAITVGDVTDDFEVLT